MYNILIIILSTIMSYPLSHLLMKKAMTIDLMFSDKNYKRLSYFFYVPLINVLIIFLYLVWVVVNFKRPE